jgi:hypothetical protein
MSRFLWKVTVRNVSRALKEVNAFSSGRRRWTRKKEIGDQVLRDYFN